MLYQLNYRNTNEKSKKNFRFPSEHTSTLSLCCSNPVWLKSHDWRSHSSPASRLAPPKVM